jgi:hypothetical protein
MINQIDARFRRDAQNLADSELLKLGIKNVQFRKRKYCSWVDFDCCGNRVRCIYRHDYGDPRVWHNLRFDEHLIDRNTFEFRCDDDSTIWLYGSNICECFTLMAFTYQIVWALRSRQIARDSARREIFALVSNCATFQDASEVLNRRPQLCAKAQHPKRSWLWAQVIRRRRAQTKTEARSCNPSKVSRAAAAEQPPPTRGTKPPPATRERIVSEFKILISITLWNAKNCKLHGKAEA